MMMFRASGSCGGVHPTQGRRIGSVPVVLWVCVGVVSVAIVILLVLILIKIGEPDSKEAAKIFNRVTIAIINNSDQNNGNITPPAIYSKDGKPLLSWRVAILPQLDEDPLYKQIRLNEPWDSDHNRQFWHKMPKCYELPGVKLEPGKTVLQVLVGNETPFRGPMPARFPASITDGPTQTICLVEAREPVNWMQPIDVSAGIADKNTLGSRFRATTGAGTMISMWDGSVKIVDLNRLSNKTWRAAITCDANDILGSDW